MREKLIKILRVPIYPHELADPTEVVADYLLDNDVVPVVRCKDCKHWKCWRISGEGSGDCLFDEGYATLATQHYDFCSYGERREGE